MMIGVHILVVSVTLFLSCSLHQAVAQNVVITGTSAIVGEDHNLVCTYTPPTGTFPAVEYTWCERGACFSPVPSNRYQISPVSLTDAHSTYRCEVILAGIGTNLGVATASLTITIPDFVIRITRRAEGGSRDTYIGQNVSYTCQALFLVPLEDVTTVLIITHSNGTSVEINDRVIISYTSGDNSQPRIEFTPITVEDAGVYSCIGTVEPLSNPLIIGGAGAVNFTITNVKVPEIEVNASPEKVGRYIDISPYNTISLTCTTSITLRGIPIVLNMMFQWETNDGSEVSPVSSEYITNNNLFSSFGTSVLSLPVTATGCYTFICRTSLNVTPATTVITSTDRVTVIITGSSIPSAPLGLTTPTENLFTDRAIIEFYIPSQSYDPEIYWILYGTTESNLTMRSPSLFSDLLADIFMTVTLDELFPKTKYYFRVIASNSVGMTESRINTFMTAEVIDNTTRPPFIVVPEDSSSSIGIIISGVVAMVLIIGVTTVVSIIVVAVLLIKLFLGGVIKGMTNKRGT